MTEPTRWVETDDGLRLAVFEEGPATAPVVVCVHGYPDNHRVWDGVAEELAGSFRVVRYDVRGAGRSDVPANRAGYRMDRLGDDLARVVSATAPDGPVHLLAHDWGSIAAWDALATGGPTGLDQRVASFTSISGPSLDAAAVWLRDVRSAPLPKVLQLLESYYIGVFLVPGVPQLMARSGLVDRLVHLSARRGPRPGTPGAGELARGPKEVLNGIELYRANVPDRMRAPRPPEVRIPVQVIAPLHDMHVSPALQAEAPAPYVPDLRVTRVDGSHWVVSREPAVVARLFADFAAEVGPGPTAPAED